MAIELANHIYRDGEGVPVVLMNAYPVDHRMWDVCAKALADFADLNDVPDFPIWAPDMAGSGASPVPAGCHVGTRCRLPLPIRSSRPMRRSASRRIGQLFASW